MKHLKTDNFDITIPERTKALLINHFVRESFGGGALQKAQPDYSETEYKEAIEVLLSSKSDTYESTADTLACLRQEQREIILSFIRTRVFNVIKEDFTLCIKDYLANYLVTHAMNEYI